MTVYTIVVEGELSSRFSSAFDGMSMRAEHGRTELVGDVVDQSQLQGLLSHIADLGLDLVSVGQTMTDPSAQPEPASGQGSQRSHPGRCS
jgi:hypothetical protein